MKPRSRQPETAERRLFVTILEIHADGTNTTEVWQVSELGAEFVRRKFGPSHVDVLANQRECEKYADTVNAIIVAGPALP